VGLNTAEEFFGVEGSSIGGTPRCYSRILARYRSKSSLL